MTTTPSALQALRGASVASKTGAAWAALVFFLPLSYFSWFWGVCAMVPALWLTRPHLDGVPDHVRSMRRDL